MEFFNLYIPTSFNIITYKKKNRNNVLTIILYNNNFSLSIVDYNKNIKIDLESYNLVFFKKLTQRKGKYIYAFNSLNKFLKTFEIYFFIKIKFKGKGFKIKFNKKLKLIKFYFGRSHMTFYKLKKTKLKKVTKYKFVLKSLNLSKLKKNASNITYVKPVNLYTQRGIRVSRQIMSKRKGKKSSYI